MRLAEVAKAEQPQFAPIAANQIKRRKNKAKHLSEISAGLGAAALATKAPGYAAAAARKFPKTAGALKPVARLAPKAEKASSHLVPATLGVGALGSINFARLQGQEAQSLKQVKKNWSEHVSPAANRAHADLGRRERRRYADAAAHGTLAGVAGLSANDILRSKVGTRGSRIRLGGAMGALALGGAFAAGNRVGEAESLERRRRKIRAKGREREAAVGKALAVMPRAPRPGGLMRTLSGRTVTRRGAIPGTVGKYPALRRF